MLKRNERNSFAISTVIFLTFLGFYVLVLLALSSGMSGATRLVTIPARMILGIFCIILLIQNRNIRASYTVWFVIFAVLYFIRIIIDIAKLEYFYIPFSDLLFYFVSFCVLPFVAISKVDFSKINMEKLFLVFLFSALFFSLLSVILYARFVGNVTRLSSGSVHEEVISPLILSYCSSLSIGVITTYLLYNKTSLKIKIISIVTIFLSIVPFFLGASRGGIFALFLPFLVLLFSNLSLKNILRYSVLLLIIIGFLVYLDSYLKSGLLDRFLGISNAIETGESSAVRILVWEKSFAQFIDNPLFGDKLNTEGVNHYPHNIYLEVLQTVGIIGFFPFVILIVKGIITSFSIFKYNPKFGWITVFFLQALMQNMFSGALYTAAWFWTGLALLLSLNKNIES